MSRWIAGLLVLALVTAGLAQEHTGPEGETPPEPTTPEVSFPEPLPDETIDEKDPGVRWERTIYVPFRELRKVFDKEGEGVYVPRKEFEALWRRAMDRPDKAGAPSSRWLVTRALYTGRVDGDLAVVDAVVDVETFHDGWTEIPLGLGGVALGQATLDGGPATMNLVKGGYRLLVPGKGKHVLAVRFVTPIGKSKDGRTVAFTCPTVPVARLDFTVPGEGVKVTVDPNLATTREDGGEKTTRVLAYVGGAGKVSLRWKPKPVDVVAGPPLLLAETRLTATYGEGVLRTDARIDYRILRAPVGTFAVRVPDGVRVLFVSGKDLRDWKVEGSGAARRIVASLHTPVRDAYSLTLTLETPAEDLSKPVPVPEIVEQNVLRAQGIVVVRGPQDTQIRPGAVAGVFRVNLGNLPRDLANARNVLAYRFPGHPYALPLLIERIRPRVTVVERTVVHVGERKRQLRSLFDVNVTRAGIFQLTFDVPADLEILEVGPAQQIGDWRVVEDGDARRLLVDLRGRRQGAFTLSVTGEAPFSIADEEVEAALPLVEPRDVERLSGTIGIRSDESFELRTKTLAGLDPLDPEIAWGRLALGRTNRPAGGLVMAFRYQAAGRSGVLLVKRKKAEVAAESVTRVTVEENRALVRTDLDFGVRYAGVDTFRFDLPASLTEDDVVITAKGLKQKVTKEIREADAEPDAQPTRREWTLTMQSKERGRIRVRLEYHVAFDALRAGGRAAVVVPDLRVHDVVRQLHWYAVTKDPVLEIHPETERVEIADPRELPEEARKEGAFLAFRTLEAAHRLTLLVRRHEYVPLLDTVVNHLHIETKLSREGVALHEATFSLRSTGRQYLPVWMPEGAKIQEVEVTEIRPSAGQPRKVRPRTDEGGGTLIPLGERGGGEKVFRVRLVYREDEVDLSGFLGESFSVEAPRFRKDDDGVPVGGTSWTLWLPPDVLVTGTSGNMSRLEPYRTWVRSALGHFLPGVSADTGGHRPPRTDAKASQESVRQGVRLRFSRAEGDAVVGASFGSPTLFFLLQVVSLLLAMAAGLWLPARRNRSKSVVCLTMLVVSLVLLAFAGRGFAMILNAVFLGALLAGATWVIAGAAALTAAWYRCRPEPVPVAARVERLEEVEEVEEIKPVEDAELAADEKKPDADDAEKGDS